MSLFNPNTIDFNGKELMESAQAVFISAFAKDEIAKFQTIVNGIVAKQQIGIVGQMSGLYGKGSNACDEGEETPSIPMSQKTWDPEMVSAKLPFCWEDLKETFWIWGLKSGIAKADLTQSEFLVFIEELLAPVIYETYMRNAWLGDKDAANVDDSPAGIITSGVDVDYLNRTDGIWKQLFEIATNDSTRYVDGLASKNGQASYSAQEFNSTDVTNKVVTKTLAQLKYKADLRLRQKPNLVYVATQSVVDQYEQELISQNAAFTLENTMNGITELKYGSITIIGFSLLDRMIKLFNDNGTKYYRPHRIVLTVPENIQIGTEEEGNLSDYKVWYSDDKNKTFAKFAFNIDAKVVINHEIQVAY
jgi:hypothetical protein